MKNEFVFCERCGAKLTTIKGETYNVIWLEYDQRTGTYTDKEVPAEFSQGGFPFGKDCAKIVLAEHEAAEQSLHADAGKSADLQAVSNASAESTSQAVA